MTLKFTNCVLYELDSCGINLANYKLPQSFLHMCENRVNRDGSKFHITILNPDEFMLLINDEISFRKLSKNKARKKLINDIREAFKKVVITKPTFVGLGHAIKSDDETYYTVVKWNDVQILRKFFGFQQRDLHITIAFNRNDIHDICKDKTTLVKRDIFRTVISFFK